jgi:hypothetical protein
MPGSDRLAWLSVGHGRLGFGRSDRRHGDRVAALTVTSCSAADSFRAALRRWRSRS